MNAKIRTIFVIQLLICMFAVPGFAGERGHSKMHHKGQAKGPAILLVTFGTSIPRAQAAFDNIDRRVRKAFPNNEVRWAYTSKIIRKKLAKIGKILDSPEVALAKLMEDGYTKVVVQSLHMIPGAEFHDIYTNAKLFGQMEGGFEKVIISNPLLANNANMENVVATLIDVVIPKERKKEEAVVLMGHGTHHSADAIYSAMMYKFQKADPNIFMGTVEGHPPFDEIKEMLISKGIKKVYLLPFMSVAGDHALNDMSGDDPESWKSQLTQAGIESIPVLKGLAEYDALADIWIDNLKAGMAHLNK